MPMSESEWVEAYGDQALRRAKEEGYQTRRGIAEGIFEMLQERTNLNAVDQSRWASCGERTSPRSEAFESRDAVMAVVRNLPRPDKWLVEVSRIVRVTVSGPVAPLHFTGVVVEVRGPDRAMIARKALDFEGIVE
jgi:hypothetical protein